MLQAFHQCPQRLVQWSWDTHLFAPLHDGPIDKVHFGFASCENILQHAGAMLAGSSGSFLYELPRIAVQFDSQLPRHQNRSRT